LRVRRAGRLRGQLRRGQRVDLHHRQRREQLPAVHVVRCQVQADMARQPQECLPNRNSSGFPLYGAKAASGIVCCDGNPCRLQLSQSYQVGSILQLSVRRHYHVLMHRGFSQGRSHL
jgi:hypothetical protein